MKIVWPLPNRRVGFLESLGLLGVVILLAARFVPVSKLPLWYCMVREHTGWPCLGCGLTRAAQHLVNGEPSAALTANPLGAVIFALLAVAAVAAALHMVFAVSIPYPVATARQARWSRLSFGAAAALSYGWVAWHTV